VNFAIDINGLSTKILPAEVQGLTTSAAGKVGLIGESSQVHMGKAHESTAQKKCRRHHFSSFLYCL